LSPGGTDTVTALPAAAAPHMGREQTGAALRLVDGGHAKLGQRGDVGKRRALDGLNNDAGHARSSGVAGKMRW
jgi:hypothetical protein